MWRGCLPRNELHTPHPKAAHDVSMVSEDPETLILSEGVFLSEDPEIGRRVHEFERKNFPFQTEECPNFIRENIFDEAVSIYEDPECTI